MPQITHFEKLSFCSGGNLQVTGETSSFCSTLASVLLQKSALLEISRSHLLTGVEGLPTTVCNASKKEILTKFLKDALKFPENFQKVISNCFQQFRSPAIQFCWNSLASATFIYQR